MAESPRNPFLLPALLLLALEGAALLTQPGQQVHGFMLAVLGQGAAYLLALRAWRRDPARIGVVGVLAVAALLRVGPLLAPVTWTSDINRYVWDGRVQNAGINPYCCLPVDDRLAPLRDDTVWTGINRAETAPTIYPPAAQMIFAVAVRLHDSVFAMKLMLLAIECLGIWAMLRILRRLGRPPSQLLLYAWMPLPAWEIAGSGHVDALVVTFVPLALWAAMAGRRGLAGVALAAAVASKFVPVVLGPAIWQPRRGDWDWRLPVAGLFALLALYLPYLGVGWRVLGYLPGYAEEEGLSTQAGSGFWPVEALATLTGLVLPGRFYLAGAALLLAGLSVAALRRGPGDLPMLRWSAVLAAALLVLISPHYPWYFVWVLVPAALAGTLPMLWLPLTAVLFYWPGGPTGIPPWTGVVVYGGFLAWSGVALWHARGRA